MNALLAKVQAFEQQEQAKNKPVKPVKSADVVRIPTYLAEAFAGHSAEVFLPADDLDSILLELENMPENPLAEVGKNAPAAGDKPDGEIEAGLAGADRFAFIEQLVRIYDRNNDTLLTVAEFKALTGNFSRVQVGDSTRAWADVWLASENRPQFKKLVFNPGYVGGEFLNRWKGWPVEIVAGNVDTFLELLKWVVGDEHVKRVLQWFAYPIQNPGKRSLFALVLISSAHGLGKGLLLKTVARLHGDGFKTPTVRQATGEFNGWLSACTFAVCEEFSIEGNRGLMARLKELITEPQVMINEKNQPAYMADILASLAFLTNDHAGLHIDPQDRRNYVIDCTNKPAPAELYERFTHWRDSGGYSALLHYLMNEVDLSDYNSNGHAPATADKAAMADLTATDLERWLMDFSDTAPKAVYTRLELKQAFEIYSGTKSTESAVGRALKRLGLGAEKRINFEPKHKRNDRPRVVAIRNPDDWRGKDVPAWADEYMGKKGA